MRGGGAMPPKPENADDANGLRLARRRYEIGRAKWPQVALEYSSFERYFKSHVSPDEAPPETYAADMYLACACADGVPEALEVFERAFAADVARAVATIDSSHAFVQENMQIVRERLFVRANDRPGKIAVYAGRASLKTWLSTVAVRSALSLRRHRKQRHNQTLVEEEDVRALQKGPEFEYLRKRYKGAFEDALRSALRRLPAKDRMLLRLNVVDGMSIDKLGALYKVGRSTAARWLAGARNTLLEQARDELHQKLRLTSTELDSIAAEMRSQLEVSVARLLARSAGRKD
jgi:RNA polymerase sigma-70 factor (ECF subfamily)